LSFRALPEHALDLLDDEALIAYIRAATEAGAEADALRGLAVLVYGYARQVERRMALRLPAHVVEDVAHEALVRAVGSAFHGRSTGEFRSWLHTIADRTVVDWYRRRERSPAQVALGEDDSTGIEAVDSATGLVELQMLIADLMLELNDRHRQVVDLHVFGDLTAREVCDRIDGVSPDNVAQIASRFRHNLRSRLNPAVGEGST
jgi:RNA polymerase sigma factor (sigma-70 family)